MKEIENFEEFYELPRILSPYHNVFGDSEDGIRYKARPVKLQDYLRHSIASVLLHMAEQMPEKGALCGEESCGYEHKDEPAFIRNEAIDDCKAILINEAKKIVGKE